MSEPATFYRKGESVNLLSKLECLLPGLFCQKALFVSTQPCKVSVSGLRTRPFLFRSLWKLDLCTIILPQIEKLLQSKYER